MRVRFFISVAVAVIIGRAAVAHDLYLMPERFRISVGETVAVALHNGDAFPESEASVAVGRLRDTVVRTREKTGPILNLRVEGNRTLGSFVVPGSGAVLLTARTVPNLIELEPDQASKYLAEEGLVEALEWRAEHGESSRPSRERYSKYIKSLLLAGAPNEFYGTVTGLLIEIIPEKDPFRLNPGDSLPVRVLFRGVPAANLQLEAAWAGATDKAVRVVGRTDAGGHVSVPLSKAGKWRLHTVKMERCAEPKAADWESFWASLTFEIR